MAKYTSIGGSIFKGSKQIIILVEVECTHKLRDELAQLLIDHLNRKAKK